MSLVVETGSGSPTAESYASVADADLYFGKRGQDAWVALSTEQKEIALRKATDWLGERYATRWAGQRSTTLQALDWPRAGVCVDRVVIASNALPAALIRATVELALKTTEGALTVDETAQVKSETVGPISTTYADGARQQTRFASVENTLAPLVAGGNVIRLVRS